ncbi:methyl-accepting chemotaxis protein, partial [Pseudomonas syringae pv. tagetis]
AFHPHQVSSLARRTTTSTQEITTKVAPNNQSTPQDVTSNQAGVDQVDKGMYVNDEVEMAIGYIME